MYTDTLEEYKSWHPACARDRNCGKGVCLWAAYT